jgi:rhamnogalacturonyl hydrolase YesR
VQRLKLFSLAIAALLSAAASTAVRAQTTGGAAFWGGFPDKADPVILGNKVVDDLTARKYDPDNRYVRRGGMDYREVCDAYGCLRFAGQTKDQARIDALVKHYDMFLTKDGEKFIPKPNNVDNAVFGILPLEIFRQTGEKNTAWKELGLKSADGEWENPREDGMTNLTRMWVDDMFMITALQVEAYRVTKDAKYLDRAAKEAVLYLDKLQQPNGLFYHADDSPFFWGRGCGWFSAGMTELLLAMPADHPQRPRILEGYKKMMAGLLKYQAPSGMWRQLVDKEESWEEPSGTGMFVFGMATGVREGWLDAATYKEPAKKGWTALAAKLDDKGQVTDTCVGTNKGSTAAKDNDAMLKFYLERPHATGDFHGQAAFIWAAWAMAR